MRSWGYNFIVETHYKKKYHNKDSASLLWSHYNTPMFANEPWLYPALTCCVESDDFSISKLVIGRPPVLAALLARFKHKWMRKNTTRSHRCSYLSILFSWRSSDLKHIGWRRDRYSREQKQKNKTISLLIVSTWLPFYTASICALPATGSYANQSRKRDADPLTNDKPDHSILPGAVQRVRDKGCISQMEVKLRGKNVGQIKTVFIC